MSCNKTIIADLKSLIFSVVHATVHTKFPQMSHK
jgi:hypothetical protein